jgi:predicted Rossmann-fold nucleotide-binding protein
VPVEKLPLKVFLCYAHADAARVHALYIRLTKDDVDVWLDKEKLLPGQDWELEIRKAVRESNVVIICLSKQFNQVGFRQKEVRLALDTAMEQPEGEIFIIPAHLEECETLESLRKWHRVDLFEDDGYERLMRSLRVRAKKIGALDIPIIHTLPVSKKNISSKKADIDPLRIMVTGGRVISRSAEKAAFAIGSQVIIRGHVLISNGVSGADRASAEGALSACEDKSLSPESFIKVYRPSDDPGAVINFGSLRIVGESYNQYRDNILDISDVVIVLGGGAGTRKVIRHILSIGKPLIPIGIGKPTDAAYDIWQKMITGFIESPFEGEDLKKIGPTQNIENVAVNALILAENLVGEEKK